MSSFLAHSIIGYAIGSQKKQKTLSQTIVVALFFIFLASTPDIDYLINYLRGEHMPIRYTHSIGFVFLVGLLGLFFRRVFFTKSFEHIPTLLFFLAPFSHLTLDFLVGVHGNPYFYPLSSEVFVSPLGVLPSSGRINIYNYYFWRNLLIELAIFIPLLMLLTPHFKRFVVKKKLLMLMLVVLFLIGVGVGLSLER